MNFNTIPEALEDLRQGKIILVTDDPDRENEGDFICAAEFATTENINFMATHGKGLICMPMSEYYVRKLGLPQMVQQNTDNHETAFTVSIDHVDTTTGISAAERSITAMKCVDPDAKPEDFRRPGHMFPLLAKEHGVLERNGHTEATVDLMRLAGLKEVGLCCEIMREDGTMMRASELQKMSQEWGLKFITIRDLQAYRKRHEVLVDRVTVTKMPTKYGDFMAYGYVNKLNGQIQLSRIDIASNPSIAQAFQIQGAPALFALIGGRPMPILQGLPSDEELQQITDVVVPKLIAAAQQAGVNGTAPYSGDPDSDAANSASAGSVQDQVPPEHQEAYMLAQQGDYAGAAAAYEKVLEADPNDTRAARERAKALLLARSANADVRVVRAAAADKPDDVDAQLAVADIDMIGGQIQDAFDRLLDFVAAGHKADIEPVRQRLLEYFTIPEPTDERLKRARRRLATLMY